MDQCEHDSNANWRQNIPSDRSEEKKNRAYFQMNLGYYVMSCTYDICMSNVLSGILTLNHTKHRDYVNIM